MKTSAILLLSLLLFNWALAEESNFSPSKTYSMSLEKCLKTFKTTKPTPKCDEIVDGESILFFYHPKDQIRTLNMNANLTHLEKKAFAKEDGDPCGTKLFIMKKKSWQKVETDEFCKFLEQKRKAIKTVQTFRFECC